MALPIPHAYKPVGEDADHGQRRNPATRPASSISKQISARILRQTIMQERQLKLDLQASGKILLQYSNHPTLDDGIDVNPRALDFYAVSLPKVVVSKHGIETTETPLKGCIRLPRSTSEHSFHYQESLLPEAGTEVYFCMDSRPDVKCKGIMMEVQYFGKGANKRMALFDLVDIVAM
jgi:hypothetical protein